MMDYERFLDLVTAQANEQIAAGVPQPDARTAYTWHATCPVCGAALVLVVDCSSGPPREVGTECEVCFALPVWNVDWWYAVAVGPLLRNDRESAAQL